MLWLHPNDKRFRRKSVQCFCFSDSNRGCASAAVELSWKLLSTVILIFSVWRIFGPINFILYVTWFIKVGGWQLKFINSWMSWSEHKTIFNLIYVNSFDKICTLNIIYMSYRWKIGKNFAQKMIINTKTDKTSCQGYQKKRNQKWSNDYRFTYHPLRQL